MLEEKDGLTKSERGGLSHQGGLAHARGFTVPCRTECTQVKQLLGQAQEGLLLEGFVLKQLHSPPPSSDVKRGMGTVSSFSPAPAIRACPFWLAPSCRSFFFFTLRVLGVSASPPPAPPSSGGNTREIPAANISREGKSSCVETCILEMVLVDLSAKDPESTGWLLGVARTTSSSSSVVLSLDCFNCSVGGSVSWGVFFFFFFFLVSPFSSKKGVPSGSRGGRLRAEKILSPSPVLSDTPFLFHERGDLMNRAPPWASSSFRVASSSLRRFFSAFMVSSCRGQAQGYQRWRLPMILGWITKEFKVYVKVTKGEHKEDKKLRDPYVLLTIICTGAWDQVSANIKRSSTHTGL